MSKMILVSLCAATALSLAACGREEENVATENFEELNATEDVNMDMNMDMNMDANMDMNMDVNATDNATDNATGNAAIDNTANSY